MGKKSSNHQEPKSPQRTKKVKKLKQKLQQPQSEQPSDYSQQVQSKKANKTIKNGSKHSIEQQQLKNKPKTRSTDQSVKQKIKNAFHQQQKKILRSMKKDGFDQDDISDSDDNNDLQQSSVSSPIEAQQQQSEEGSNSEDSDKQWDIKGKKKKIKQANIMPGFHRKINISYEIMDKRDNYNNAIECEIDGKKSKIQQRQILSNLETMRKSIQNLELLFRGTAQTNNKVVDKQDQKQQSSQMNVNQLIQKYTKPINTQKNSGQINNQDMAKHKSQKVSRTTKDENEFLKMEERYEKSMAKKKSKKRTQQKQSQKRIMIQ